MTFSLIDNIALFLLVGHVLNCGCNFHSSGIRGGIVRSINAIGVFVYSHILRPSPHSVNLCSSVSAIEHLWQEFECSIFIRRSREIVGIKSCSTWYHIHLVLSDTGVSFKFFHIRVQSLLGDSFCMRISGDPVAVLRSLKGLRKVFIMGFVVFRVTSYGRACRFDVVAI